LSAITYFSDLLRSIISSTWAAPPTSPTFPLDVEIKGNDDYESYTKWHPVLNRSSLRPGDLLSTKEINATKRRLMASQLFNTNPTQGALPEFIFDYPKESIELEAKAADKEAEIVASGDPQFRGQVPPKQSFYQKIFPAKLAEPVIQYAPEYRLNDAIQTAPVKETYRGQAPAYYTPPMPAQVYAPNTTATTYATTWGSVAPASSPLQASSAASAVGMTPMQYQMPGAQMPGAETATILGNPYDTLNAPSTVRVDPNAPTGISPFFAALWASLIAKFIKN